MIHVAVADWYQTRTFSFTKTTVIVGCSPDADLVLDREGVAPHHVRLALRDDGIYVDDLRDGSSAKPVAPDDVIRVAGIDLRVSLVPLEPEDVLDEAERRLVDEIRANPGDPAPRLVYADWLDEHGHLARAEFLRVQLAANAARTPGDPAFARAAGRLRTLGAVVGVGWRSLVGMAFVENCEAQRRAKRKLAMELVCPMRWDKLTPTEHAGIRSCSACKETVTYCTSIEQARTVAQSGGCIAVDIQTKRSEYDLEGPMMVGRPSPPFSRYGGRGATDD